ncbi:MAG: hypothetical protein DYH06_13955 [Acidobacteria bacterium ACB2]|nr:hypothetical protein [Acidobacteria bacterium ACB2]
MAKKGRAPEGRASGEALPAAGRMAASSRAPLSGADGSQNGGAAQLPGATSPWTAGAGSTLIARKRAKTGTKERRETGSELEDMGSSSR